MSLNHRTVTLAALVAGIAAVIPFTAAAATKPAAKPEITKLSLTSAKPLEKFYVDGKDFTKVTSVKIDGMNALYKVDSAVKIQVTVPKNAKTGKVEVMTKAGDAFSAHSLKIT